MEAQRSAGLLKDATSNIGKAILMPRDGPMGDRTDAATADFMRDDLADGRSFGLFNMLADVNRQGLGIEVNLSLIGSTLHRHRDAHGPCRPIA